MGWYLNPENESKEAYLRKHATEVSRETAKNHEDYENNFLVILVDNGLFTAAGICVDTREKDDWLADRSGRDMRYFLIPAEFVKKEVDEYKSMLKKRGQV